LNYVKFILMKIIETAATDGNVKFDFGWGSPLRRSPDRLAGFKGPPSKGKGGEWK